MSIEEELKKIEAEERVIESEERKIEEKEDLLRVFEELGLMRWKSYYILTAGAILLLSLTFVTALWVMQGQLGDIQTSIDDLTPPETEWCSAGESIVASFGDSTIKSTVIGLEEKDGKTVCHSRVVTTGGDGTKTVDLWKDKSGQSLEISES